jgi:serine/threonine protein kinase
MEPLMSITLSELVKSPRSDHQLTEFDECAILGDVFNGLAFIHLHGYMHRDIKPGNIGVDLNPARAAILDLGACTQATESHNQMVGTIAYLAPEIINLKRHTDSQTLPSYTSQADVWSAALSGAEFLCHTSLTAFWLLEQDVRGVTAFSLDQVRSHLRHAQQYGSQQSRAVFGLIYSALSSEPADRPVAQQLSDEMKAAKSEMLTLSRDTNTPSEPPHRRRKV